MNAAWQQSYYPWGQSLLVSATIAAIPPACLLWILAVLRKPAWMASLAGLTAAVAVALIAYGLSPVHTMSAALYGAAFGLFPISWIVLWALVLYRISVETGKFEIIKSSVGYLTTDMRLQALLIAFAFGAFLEGCAGFGTPVAVAAAVMTEVGFAPLQASAICLLANTAPVAFGSIGIPAITLAAVTGLPLNKLSADLGRICAPVSLLLPTYLIASMSGWTGVREVWPALLMCGGIFASVQFLVSNFIGPQLTDILSSLATIAGLVVLLRAWHPAVLRAAGAGNAISAARYSRREVASAWAPYLLLIAFVLAWGYKPIQQLLNGATVSLGWPRLHNEILRMPPAVAAPVRYAAMYNLNFLSAAGSACMFACFASALVLRVGLGRFARLFVAVVRQLVAPTATVAAVLATAFVMNYCGATGTLGLAFAATGALFPLFSALTGWLGVFLTGSDTSSNALFGSLQVITAEKLRFDPVLLAAGSSAGGVMGKMISLQTIAVAAAATGMSNEDQAKLFRLTIRHSVLLVLAVGLEILIYTYLRVGS